MPEEVSARNAYMQGLKHAFDAEYADAGFTWAEVKAALSGVFEHLHLYVINSKRTRCSTTPAMRRKESG